MGGCGSTSSDVDSEARLKQKKVQSSNVKKNNNELEINEANFPEVSGEHYIGQGVKRIKAYKCNLRFNDLAKKREEFWKNRQSRQWLALKEICETDHETAETLLLVAELECCEGNLQKTKDMNNDKVYLIPNWVIQDPIIIVDFEDIEKNLIPKNITIYLNEVQINVNTKITGSELKQFYIKLKGVNYSKVRIFFRGSEIKDDISIGAYSVESESRLMVISVLNQEEA